MFIANLYTVVENAYVFLVEGLGEVTRMQSTPLYLIADAFERRGEEFPVHKLGVEAGRSRGAAQ